MAIPEHHYAHVLSSLLDDQPDLTLQVKCGQVLCHKPILACHSNLLKEVLLHTDTNIIMLPDFGKKEVTALVEVLYGLLTETCVSKQLLQTLGMNVNDMSKEETILKQKMETSPVISTPTITNANSNLGRIPPSMDSQKSIFDIDDLEEGNKIVERKPRCCNCLMFVLSLSELYTHMEACHSNKEGMETCPSNEEGMETCHSNEDMEASQSNEEDMKACHSNKDMKVCHSNKEDMDTYHSNGDMEACHSNKEGMETSQYNEEEIIYQCSVCDLVCDSLQHLHDHMTIQCNHNLENTETIIDNIEEAVINAKFVIQDNIDNKENNQKTEYTIPEVVRDINATDIIVDEINGNDHTNTNNLIIEEVDDNDILVIDEDVQVQDPTIETTEVTVSSEIDSENTVAACSESDMVTDHHSEFIDESVIGVVPCDIVFEDIHEKSPAPDLGVNSKHDLVMTNREQYYKKFNFVEMMINSENESQEETECCDDRCEGIELHADDRCEGMVLHACQFCSKSFSTEAILRLHTQSAHKNVNLIQNKLHHTSTSEHKSQDESEFVCELCECKYNSLSCLKEHSLKSHPQLYENDQMGEGQDDILIETIEVNDVIEGQEQVANQEVSLFFCCTRCENSFDSPKALIQHVIANHVAKPENLLPVSCQLCNLNFIVRSTLAKHYRVVHPNQKQIYVCPHCQKTLKTSKSLERHEIRHTGIKPFKCGQCQSEFFHGETLKVHAKKGCKQKENNDDPVVSICVDAENKSIDMSCTKCSLHFASHQDYLSHQCKTQCLTCPNCETIFKSTRNLQTHLKHDCSISLNTHNLNLEGKSIIPQVQEDNWYNIVDASQEYIDNKPMEINIEEKENLVKGSKKTCKDVNEKLTDFSDDNLVSVLETHGSDPVYKYTCAACAYNTNIKNQFSNHLDSLKHKENSHTKKYSCENCDRKFGSLIFLDDHINRKHKERKIKKNILQDIIKDCNVDEETKSSLPDSKTSQITNPMESQEKLRELKSKSGRRIIPKKFADGEEVSSLVMNKSKKKRKIDSTKTTLELYSSQELINSGEEVNSQNAPNKKAKVNIDIISTQCELCEHIYESRKKLFVHMLSHVPAGIRASLPRGSLGWCPHCPGPVPVKQINCHVLNLHPETVNTGEDLECVGTACDAQVENKLGSNLELIVCPPVFVKMVPVDLTKYGIRAKDYM